MIVDRAGRVAIVGAGLAGSRCAAALRRHGHQGSITLFGAEEHSAYERPSLSKGFLAGTRARDELSVAGTAAAALQTIGVDVRLGHIVSALGPRSIEVQDGPDEPFDALVLATGAVPRTVPSMPLGERVHELRTLGDAERLRDAFQPGQHLVIVGSGFIGSEVASTARACGMRVTLLEAAQLPMAGKLGDAASAWMADRWRARGVDVRCGVAVRHVASAPEQGGVRVSVDGADIIADYALIAIGTRARDELFHQAWPGHGAVGSGIPVDASGRTARPGVWAIGDVTSRVSEGGSVRRVEHWTDAVTSADRVARHIVGAPVTAVPAPYAWSDQFGFRVQIAGVIDPTMAQRVDIVDEQRLLVRFFDAVGRPAGVVGVGQSDEIAAARVALAA